ncbi:corticotropin-releasing factor receptor 2-like isoform X2 [Varroa jacobsoni]|uniref:corticotropin-releasing factor receptor 2-like isoform X2 n=1 Tax=Varroa jacobsoni TaxID=62625 RepID=UPI000BF91CAC|nr:corticotropin-releasing factor receptor 2-like isoform X2 [Varroa jacobsoni]
MDTSVDLNNGTYVTSPALSSAAESREPAGTDGFVSPASSTVLSAVVSGLPSAMKSMTPAPMTLSLSAGIDPALDINGETSALTALRVNPATSNMAATTSSVTVRSITSRLVSMASITSTTIPRNRRTIWEVSPASDTFSTNSSTAVTVAGLVNNPTKTLATSIKSLRSLSSAVTDSSSSLLTVAGNAAAAASSTVFSDAVPPIFIEETGVTSGLNGNLSTLAANVSRTVAALATQTRLIYDELFVFLSEEECLHHRNIDPNTDSQAHCPVSWDGAFCWNSAPSGFVVARSCRSLLETQVGYKPVDATLQQTPSDNIPQQFEDRYALRGCGFNGQWDHQTNYNACLDHILTFQPKEIPYSLVPLATTYLILIFSLISVVFLMASAFIYVYFRTLKCSRTKVHLNLVTSLIIQSLAMSAISGPLVVDQARASHDDTSNIEYSHVIKKNPVLCKMVLCLQMYSSMSSINWMFIEGLLLHSKITTSIFSKSAPFKLYYTIGWGVPVIFIVPWAVEMEATSSHSRCWEGYAYNDWTWLLVAPRLTAVAINFCFLSNIVRILVSRVRSAENDRFRKGIKATLLLFPLLGTSHLLFCFNPQDSDKKLKDAYMITNGILMSTQGRREKGESLKNKVQRLYGTFVRAYSSTRTF